MSNPADKCPECGKQHLWDAPDEALEVETRLNAEIQRLTEELRAARDELRWYEEVLKLAKANIAFGEAERDALQKQLADTQSRLERQVLDVSRQAERIEKAEAALKQYAELDNWIKRRGVDVWIGPNEGPDLAKSALGNAGDKEQ